MCIKLSRTSRRWRCIDSDKENLSGNSWWGAAGYINILLNHDTILQSWSISSDSTILRVPNISRSQSPNNGILKPNGVIYPSRQSVFPSESEELPHQIPQLGNTGKYRPSRASPIRDFSVLGQLYWAYIIPYCPVEDSVVAALRIHQRVRRWSLSPWIF